jgi:hypothetical protein
MASKPQLFFDVSGSEKLAGPPLLDFTQRSMAMGKSEGKGEIRAAQLTPALYFELDMTMPGPPRCLWTPCAIGGKGDLDDLVAILEAERILQQVVVHEEPCDTLEEIVDESERDGELA